MMNFCLEKLFVKIVDLPRGEQEEELLQFELNETSQACLTKLEEGSYLVLFMVFMSIFGMYTNWSS